MTAETAVCKEVPAVVTKPSFVTEERCELYMSSARDLPKPDTNGVNNRDHNNDPYNSFVFVGGTNGLSDDPSENKDVVGENLSVFPYSKPVEVQNEELDAQKGKLDVENGNISESMEERKIGVAEGNGGSPLLDNSVAQDQEKSIGDGDEVHVAIVDDLEEQNGKSEIRAEAEIKPVEVQNGKTESTEESEIEQIQDQDGETGGSVEAVADNGEDRPELEVFPSLDENQESQVVILGSDVELVDGRELNNLSLDINESGYGNDQFKDQNNLESTQESGVGQRSEDVAIHASGHEPQGVEVGELSSQEQIGVKLAEVAGTLECKVPLTTSAHLDSEYGPINNEEKKLEYTNTELDSDEMKNPKCDPALSDNNQDRIGQEYKVEEMAEQTKLNLESETVSVAVREETKEDFPVSHAEEAEEMVDETDLNFETGIVSGSVLEENKNLPVSHVRVLDPEETDACPNCNEESPEIEKSETHIDAAVPTESFPASSSEAHEPQKETEICEASSIEYVSSSPVDGPISEINVESESPEVVKPETETDAVLSTDSVPSSSSEAHEPQEEIEICDAKCVEDVSLSPVDGPKFEINIENKYSKVVKAETEIDAALPMDGIPASNSEAHEPQKEIDNCDGKRVEDVSSSPSEGPKAEFVVENGGVVDDKSLSCIRNDASSESESALEMIDYKEKQTTIQGNDACIQTEVSSGNADCANNLSLTADVILESEAENSSAISSQDITTDAGVACGSEDSDSSVVTKDANISLEMKYVENLGDQLVGREGSTDENMLLQESKDAEKSHGGQASTASPESSSADVIAREDINVEAVTRPFNFLIRIPRFNDEKLREEIVHAQLQVEEKTQLRDAIRLQIQKKRAQCQTHGIEFEAAKLEDKAGRKLVRSKRLEIDSLLSVLNRAKNAMSIEDIDGRIQNMEHVMQHETLPLKEEKEFIREIKRLKQLREQLSSNMGSQDDIQQALDQREEVEEHLKISKKELDSLKASVLKSEAAAIAAEKKYEDENKKVRELQAQFRAADDIRQAAYTQLLNLKKELFEKNKHFRMYKDDAAAASDYAFSKNKEALNRHCVNQVEKVMELWNSNSDFRKEYVKYNTRSTLRRLGTLDGRALGPDEEPPILPSYVDRRVDRFGSTPPMVDYMSHANRELKQEEAIETVTVDDQSRKKVAESKNTEAKTKGPSKSIPVGLGNTSAIDLTDEIEEEPVIKKTKEELELERKADELRKKEAEIKLREQRRLEEIAKAKEALERKKRNAEKAQMRAELRAQKEAEQIEKEREKRLRKKERKKAAGSDVNENNDFETDSISESPVETIKETEVKGLASSVTKRSSKHLHFAKQSKTKSIPPPLRNRNRKKFQQWMWVILTSLVVIALFWLGNMGAFANINFKRQSPLS